MAERIQKYLAHLGIASRRKIEQWVTEGRIQINGYPAHLGQLVSDADQILVDGEAIRPATVETQVIMLHKPVGTVCSRRSEKGFPSVFELLPPLAQGRWVAIGRLDVNTSGLLLLTTNGELAEKLMHPRYGFEREYLVRVSGHDIALAAEKIRAGITLEDGKAEVKSLLAIKAEGRNHWYRMVLTEGRNRLVRRLWEAAGCQVNRLKRTRFGEIELDSSLKSGSWRYLSKSSINRLAKNDSFQ